MKNPILKARTKKGKLIYVQKNCNLDFHDVETKPHPKVYQRKNLSFDNV